MSWSYCGQWNWLREKPIDPIDPAEAARRHAAGEGEGYTAVSEEDGSVDLVVDVALAPGNVAVHFADEFGRRELIYTFRRQENGHLFLSEVISYEYGDSTDRGDYAEPIGTETFEFDPDGVVRRITQDSARGGTLEERDTVDVAPNWEPVPAFGQYDSITREDRG
jgi:hypothetical protein